MNNGRHSGEVALVTGANKGIGREIARRLAAEGVTVYLGARDEDRGRRAARDLAGDAADVRVLQLDVTEQAQIDAAVKRVDEEFGRLDVLVNNAGIGIEWGDAVEEVTVEQVRRTYEVNVFGVVAMTRACIPLLRRSAAARVVNLSSPLGSLGLISFRCRHARLQLFQDRAELRNPALRERVAKGRHSRQRGKSRLRGHRPQRSPRAPDRRARRRPSGKARAPGR